MHYFILNIFLVNIVLGNLFMKKQRFYMLKSGHLETFGSTPNRIKKEKKYINSTSMFLFYFI